MDEPLLGPSARGTFVPRLAVAAGDDGQTLLFGEVAAWKRLGPPGAPPCAVWFGDTRHGLKPNEPSHLVAHLGGWPGAGSLPDGLVNHSYPTLGSGIITRKRPFPFSPRRWCDERHRTQ